MAAVAGFVLCHVVMLLAAYNTDWFIIHAATYRIISLSLFTPSRLPFRFLPVVGLFIVVQMQGRTYTYTDSDFEMYNCGLVGWLLRISNRICIFTTSHIASPPPCPPLVASFWCRSAVRHPRTHHPPSPERRHQNWPALQLVA